jgi:hypothetical protein
VPYEEDIRNISSTFFKNELFSVPSVPSNHKKTETTTPTVSESALARDEDV